MTHNRQDGTSIWELHTVPPIKSYIQQFWLRLGRIATIPLSCGQDLHLRHVAFFSHGNARVGLESKYDGCESAKLVAYGRNLYVAHQSPLWFTPEAMLYISESSQIAITIWPIGENFPVRAIVITSLRPVQNK